MYWYGENERRKAADWRPEIHDSDGLALWTGKGERIWRPLVDPPRVMTNAFMDDNPKGFGLIQRDRDFENYQDDGAFYNKRPSIWVEPRGNWGPGAVQLVEIPTDDEIHDNIVAYWRPEGDIKSGGSLAFDYRLYWQDSEPAYPADIARVVATRLGIGGIPGQTPAPRDKRKFVVDFTGGPLMQMQQRYDITPVANTSRGKIDNAYVIKVVGTDRWRALFDLQLEGNAPADLRLFLRLGDKNAERNLAISILPLRSALVGSGKHVGEAAERQGILVHARRDHVARGPGEEQQHRVIGVVGKAVARIGGGEQLARLGVKAGGDELGDALLFRLFEESDFGHGHRIAGGVVGHRQLRNADQERLLVGGKRTRCHLHHGLGLVAVIHQHQSVPQHLGPDGGDRIAIVIALEIAGIDKDAGALGDAQRQLLGGAVGSGRDQQLLACRACRRGRPGRGAASQHGRAQNGGR